ncbi:MAG: hypothetical protein ABI155_04160 [Paralcaligenes sp.]
MKATNITEASESEGLVDCHIEAFLERLRTARYSVVTLCNKRRVLSAFSRWMKSKNVALVDLDESVLLRFVALLSAAPQARVQFELSVIRRFLVYLRGQTIVPDLPLVNQGSVFAQIYDRYVGHLRQDRGLSPNSVCVYASPAGSNRSANTMYGIIATRNNRGVAHENGAIESPNNHSKRPLQRAHRSGDPQQHH